MQPAPEITREDIERLVRRDYGHDSAPGVLKMLEEYGTEGWHREPERVRAAILKLSGGKLEKLRHNVETAKKDYRDVLAYAEYPRYFMEPGVDAMPAAEREKIIQADWKDYQEWLHREAKPAA